MIPNPSISQHSMKSLINSWNIHHHVLTTPYLSFSQSCFRVLRYHTVLSLDYCCRDYIIHLHVCSLSRRSYSTFVEPCSSRERFSISWCVLNLTVGTLQYISYVLGHIDKRKRTANCRCWEVMQALA